MGRYEKLVERCKKIGLVPPPKEAYSKSYLSIKGFIESLLNIAEKDNPLPDEFVIEGDWVASLVDGSGKAIYVRGENLKIST